MKIEEFLQHNEKRLNHFVLRFCRIYQLSRDHLPDLKQTAILSAITSLPYWRSEGGRNAFNFCAPAMNRAMRRLLQSEFASIGKRVEFEDVPPVQCSRSAVCTSPELLDLRRTLARDPKPHHLVRFIASALSPASGGDLARVDGLSRQAFYKRQKTSKERLLANLG